MSKKILAITGRKQSGKDSLGNFLVSNATELFGPGFVVRRFGFADPLKEMVSNLFGVPLEWMHGSEKDKNRLTTVCWGHLPHFDRENEVNGRGSDSLTVRELLQQFGTEVVRRMSEDAWVNALHRKIERDGLCDLAVIPDCRFPNEILAVKEWGGKAIRLTRNQEAKAEHESEWSLDRDYFDWDNFDVVVDNRNMSLGNQNHHLAELLREWGWRKQGEKK